MSLSPVEISVIGYQRTDGGLVEVVLFEGNGFSDEGEAAIEAARAAVQDETSAVEMFEVVTHRRSHVGGVCRCKSF